MPIFGHGRPDDSIIEKVQKILDILKGRERSLLTEIVAQLAAINARLDLIDDRLEAIEGRLSEIEAKLQQIIDTVGEPEPNLTVTFLQPVPRRPTSLSPPTLAGQPPSSLHSHHPHNQSSKETHKWLRPRSITHKKS